MIDARHITAATLPHHLERLAAKYGSKPAIHEKRRGAWRSSTWADTALAVRSLAVGFSKQGIEPGDRAAIATPMNPRTFCGILALQTVGAVPVLPHLGISARDVVAQLGPLHVDWIVSEDERIIAEFANLGKSTHPFVFDDIIALSEAGVNATAPEIFARAGDPALVVFTPGSSGEPHAVELTHEDVLDAAGAFVRTHGLTPSDRQLLFLSLSGEAAWTAGWAASLVAGFAIGYPEAADTVPGDIREFAPSILVGTPAVYRRLRGLLYELTVAQSPWRRRIIERRILGKRVLGAVGLRRVRVAISVGERLPPSVAAFFGSFGFAINDLGGRPAARADLAPLESIEAALEGSYFIRHAVAFLDAAGNTGVLIALDRRAIYAWARAEDVDLGDSDALHRNQSVHRLLAGEIAKTTASHPDARVANLSRFVVSDHPFSFETGELTAGGTLRRRAALERHHDLIADALTDETRAVARLGLTVPA